MFEVLLVVPRLLFLQFEFFLHVRVGQHFVESISHFLQPSGRFFYQNMMKQPEFNKPSSAVTSTRAAGTGERSPQGGLTLRTVMTKQ